MVLGQDLQMQQCEEGILYTRDLDEVDFDDIPSSKDVDFVGRMAYGHGFGIATHGTIAYYSKFHVIEIADLRDLKNIKILSRVRTPDRVTKIVWQDNKLYLSNWAKGIRVIDVSDPKNPILLGSFAVDAILRDISVVDGIVYLAAGTHGLNILDATNPSDIKLLGSFPVKNESMRITSDGIRAYLSENKKLHIFDVTDPFEPKELGSITSSSYEVKNLVIQNDTLYTVQDYGTLHIFDATDPTRVRKITSFDTGGRSWRIKKKENLLYIADESKLSIVDVTDLKNIKYKASYEGNLAALYDLELMGDYVVCPDFYRGLFIINVKHPKGPKLEGFLKTFGNIVNITATKDYIFLGKVLTEESNGIRIINTTNKNLPFEENFFHLKYQGPTDLLLVDSLLYVTQGLQGLKIVNVHDPINPTIIGSYLNETSCIKVEVVDSLAFIATALGFVILDISDAYNPIEIVDFRETKYTGAIAVKDSILFAAHTLSNGFQFSSINISDLSKPFILDTKPTYKEVEDIKIVDNYAYLANAFEGLKVFAISRPKNLKYTTQLSVEYVLDISIEGNLAYLANGRGISIVDFTKPYELKEVGWYQTDDWTRRITLRDGYIYTASQNDGMYILKYDPVTGISEVANRQPNTYNLRQNYPNPFNATTTVEFSLEEKSHVSLAVFNTAGKRVAELSSKVYTQGTHILNWDAGNLGSGVYFIRLKSEPLGAGSQPFVQTIKSILLK